MGSRSKINQSGLTLTGFLVLLVLLGMVAIVAMRVVPTVAEYFSIKKAIVQAKENGGNPSEIRRAFDRQASVGYITTVRGKDLSITQNNGGYEVSFFYEKVIPLFGPASLLLEYQGSTDKAGGQKPASR